MPIGTNKPKKLQQEPALSSQKVQSRKAEYFYKITALFQTNHREKIVVLPPSIQQELSESLAFYSCKAVTRHLNTPTRVLSVKVK